MLVIFIIIFFVAFLLVGTPLYVMLFLISSFLFFYEGIPLLSIIVSFQKLQSQEFISAIPLFTFAGYVLSNCKSPQRIIDFTQKCFPFIPGSTSFIVIVIMALFTALTGASGVSILALGGLFYPLLKKSTNDDHFSHGLITASGSIGLLLAPSLPVIIYAIVSNQNALIENRVDIETLFKVALLPSIILIGGFFLYSLFKERKKQRQGFNFEEAWASIKEAKWEIPLPFLVYGGIYSGWFTVLEASVVTALYTFVVVFIVKKELSLMKDFMPTTINALKLSGGIFIIMATAFIFTNYVVYTQLPDKIFFEISSVLTTKVAFLISLNVLLLIAGCFLDIFSAILIVLPLLIPIVEKYGIDPYHFAIIFLVNLEIGYITPPVGLNLFIASYRFKKPILFLYRSTIPFLFIMLFSLTMITFVPPISTFTLEKKTGLNDSNDTSANEKNALKKINDLQIKEITSSSATFEFDSNQGYDLMEVKSISIKMVDLNESDPSIILDLGEEVIIENNQLQEKNGKFFFILADLLPDTDYSLIMEIIDRNDKGGANSPIIYFTTEKAIEGE